VLRLRVPRLTPSLHTYNRRLGAWEPTVEPFGLSVDASVFSAVNDQVRVALWNPSHRSHINSGGELFNRGFDRAAPIEC
jgi:hypothetical protein